MSLVDFPKELAAHSLVRATDARRVLTEEHSAAFKWLMASFLAVNGGGMLALIDAEIPFRIKIVSGAFFWFGIICAFALAWRGQVLNRRYLTDLSKVEAFWATVSSTGELDTDEFEQLEGTMNSVKTWQAKAFGWASVTAFTIGSAMLGYGLS